MIDSIFYYLLDNVVRLAKNPYGSKTRMKTLRDLEGNEIKEEERARALEKVHFL